MLKKSLFEEHYFLSKGKIKDSWMETVSFLPFTTNTSSSGYDQTCGLSGVTGEFFRKCSSVEIKPIANYNDHLNEPLRAFLNEKGQMRGREINELMTVVKDIMFPESSMNIVDASFLPYIPLVEEDIKESRLGKKIVDGEKKLAEYLYSMLDLNKRKDLLAVNENSNLFSNCVKSGMERGKFSNIDANSKYYILPFIRSLFNADLQWLLGKEDYVIIKNIHYLLHFYICLSLSQTIAHIIHWEKFSFVDVVPFYYMLTSEHASRSREVVQSGWEKWISREALQKLFGRTQALDIFNTLLGKPVGLYSQIINVLGEESFDENKLICEEILSEYLNSKRDLLANRKNININELITNFDCTVSSYREFFTKLTKLCIALQSPDYNAKIEKRVNDLFQIKILDNRRGMRVLTLDEDLLVFLIAMVTKERRTKLDSMYSIFKSYGIFFDINTRILIENHLKKMNLLESKSDSGEAQYVTVIL